MGREQLRLTPSEQRLTEAIVNGVPLNEAAEQLGILPSTARTRLKTIQTKTNCHRQVDLVRLALSLPVGPGGLSAYSTGRRASPRGPKASTSTTLAISAAAIAVNIAIAPLPTSSGNSASGTSAEVTRFTAQAPELARGPQRGREQLGSIDAERRDIDRADQVESDAEDHQRRRRRCSPRTRARAAPSRRRTAPARCGARTRSITNAPTRTPMEGPNIVTPR